MRKGGEREGKHPRWGQRGCARWQRSWRFIQRRQTWKRSGGDTTSRASGIHSTRGSERNSTGGSKNRNFGFTMKNLNSFILHLRCLHQGLFRCFSESLTRGKTPIFPHTKSPIQISFFQSLSSYKWDQSHFPRKGQKRGWNYGGQGFFKESPIEIIGGWMGLFWKRQEILQIKPPLPF